MPIFDYQCKKCKAIEEHVITGATQEKELKALRCASVIGEGAAAKKCGGKMVKTITARPAKIYQHETLADLIYREQSHRPDFDYKQNRALNELPRD